LLPLRDENPTLRRPLATVTIITLNVLAWGTLQGLGSERALAESLCLYGLIPGDVLGVAPAGSAFALADGLVCVTEPGVEWLPLLTSMFMHGGWLHILGNMWFLWVFGDNVEDAMGPLRFAVFYVACGLAAAAAQMLSDPSSLVPMVGASGAIGGVMGAYALLYPRAHVHTLVILGFYVTTVAVPAWLMLGYWFLLQVLGGLPDLAGAGAGGGVAFWAHAGGFVAGLVLAPLLRVPEYVEQHRAQQARRLSRHRLP
jgi:membrane associated rhomboid family serine protease